VPGVKEGRCEREGTGESREEKTMAGRAACRQAAGAVVVEGGCKMEDGGWRLEDRDAGGAARERRREKAERRRCEGRFDCLGALVGSTFYNMSILTPRMFLERERAAARRQE
jgi:hypothetical protein